jgi:hypothetical protein
MICWPGIQVTADVSIRHCPGRRRVYEKQEIDRAGICLQSFFLSASEGLNQMQTGRHVITPQLARKQIDSLSSQAADLSFSKWPCLV